ncbi:MAG TPA: hypothetical protein VD866_29190, partial [Urbifossiella sp.]|nr:hypothetical protein [Urbifossiella sp.]
MSDVHIRGTALTVDGTADTSADFPWLLAAVGAGEELAFVAPVVTPAAGAGTGFAVAGGLTLLGQAVTGATLTV